MIKHYPLLDCAEPALVIIAQLRNQQIIPTQDEMLATITHFTEGASQQHLSEKQIHIASYLLCTAIDEAYYASNTATIDDNNLLGHYHHDNKGGEKFFVFLEQLLQAPENHQALLQLSFLCLASGFQGKYALVEQGTEILLKKRKQVFNALEKTNLAPSPVNKITQKKKYPLMKWIISLIAVAALLSVGFHYLLGNRVALLQSHLQQVIVKNQSMEHKS